MTDRPWPAPEPLSWIAALSRVCLLLRDVWLHFDPHGYEANDCFCKTWFPERQHMFRTSGQSIAWVESVVRAELARLKRVGSEPESEGDEQG